MIKKFLGKLAEPTAETGEWVDRREAFFWHDHGPFTVKYAVEKMTATLLRREPQDDAGLVYVGRSGGSEEREIHLRFEAVVGRRKLYALALRWASPRRWVTEEAHRKAVERAFSFWCDKLELAPPPHRLQASAAMFDTCRREAIELEEAAARVVEDPAPIRALQAEVLGALRSGGMGFFTAHKEGGTHIFFDGQVFVRSDYGDEPNTCETYADDLGMIACLRHFYDWEARRNDYPHMPPEREVWAYIRSQLSPRRG